MISVPTDLAGFCIPFVPVLIGFNYSAHVSFACLVLSCGSLFEPGALSSALWEHNKVIITLASAFWLANLICYIYSAPIP